MNILKIAYHLLFNYEMHNSNSFYLIKKLGEIIKNIRCEKSYSGRKLSYEYDISRSNLSKIENGIIDCKITSLWKISQVLGVKLSDLIVLLENELGENFSLLDE